MKLQDSDKFLRYTIKLLFFKSHLVSSIPVSLLETDANTYTLSTKDVAAKLGLK